MTQLETMGLTQRLMPLHKDKDLTQQGLAGALELRITQIKHYKSNAAQYSLEASKRMAQNLRVTMDSLILEPGDLEPDGDISLQLKAASNVPSKKRHIVKELLGGRHDYQIRDPAMVF